jgi:hypothetical protein
MGDLSSAFRRGAQPALSDRSDGSISSEGRNRHRTRGRIGELVGGGSYRRRFSVRWQAGVRWCSEREMLQRLLSTV